ncbi:MAG: hypothetical protein HYX66_00720 [Ignavibacteria bacterium]|nr:hypothetical protein [Ignavibacteria bacterium]
MNELDRLLKDSMNALNARNEFVFESTRQHMQSVIKGGSSIWPWVTVLSAVAVVVVSLIVFQQKRINPVRVTVPDVEKSIRTLNLKSPNEEYAPVIVPPLKIADAQNELPAQTRVMEVRDSDKALADLFTAQNAYAESASLRGDHFLSAITYRDLARTCLLNNDKRLAWKAIQMALGEARHVNTASLTNEIELLAKIIAK